MNIQSFSEVLLWCLVFNYAVLLLWFLVFILGHDWLYQLHTRWFGMPIERFDAIHYAAMATYKIGILLFNLTPYIALLIVR